MSAAAEPKPAPVPAEESIVKTEEGAEPQNPLTQKFTEAEWKAVKELRVRRACRYRTALLTTRRARCRRS